MILVLVNTSFVASQYFRLWHNEKREGVVVWGEVHRASKATPFTLYHNIERPYPEPPRAFWDPGAKLMNESSAREANRKCFRSPPLDWLKNAFQSNSCSQIVKIFNWGPLDPEAPGQTAPPAPLSAALLLINVLIY